MTNSKIIFQELLDRINTGDDRDEIRSIALILMDKLFDVGTTEVMSGKMVAVTTEAMEQLDRYIARINNNEPVQYVIGEAYFFGRSFKVNPAVLIPRPETEMLVRTALAWLNLEHKSSASVTILDIGTGSGCIPITLYLEWPDAKIVATDVSAAALLVAKENAEMLKADVRFVKHDILSEVIEISPVDIIVSNPPYVTRNENREMRRNVLDFEPHGALFVPDGDPLLFYREMIAKARPVLAPGGLMAVEINARFGAEIAGLFRDNGFSDVAILHDLDGKDRIVRALA